MRKWLTVIAVLSVAWACSSSPIEPPDVCYKIIFWTHLQGDTILAFDSVTYEAIPNKCPSDPVLEYR